MEIDVITLTGEQYAQLSPEQIEKVREAQVKKNSLETALAEAERKVKYDLVKSGTFRSCVYKKLCTKLESEYDAKVASIRDGLLFYLQYSAQSESAEGASAPYANYALSPEERVVAVKAYYETTYSSASDRFNAFKKDKTALTYLGEYYSATYDYFSQGT